MASIPDTTDAMNFVVIHGHRRAYRMMGEGPAILLLHGLGCDSSTWLPVMEQLAEHHTVVAPDLLGHGQSDKPIADYSLGGFANGMRDLLTVLGIAKVTVVGHSFGGGVAMQFAYQFPERTDRLCLVASGGLGSEVSAGIRFLATPGSGAAIALAAKAPIRPLVATALRTLDKVPFLEHRDLDEVANIYESFADPHTAWAVRRVANGVLNHRRQLISMTDRAYLTQAMGLQVIWGAKDSVIPVHHTETVAAYAPGARIDIFDNVGHFPHRDEPEKFVSVVRRFMDETPPAQYHRGRWRALLRHGADQVAINA